MQPHQQRVIDEQAEVGTFLSTTRDRATKLEAFFGASVFKGLPQDEQGRLFRQVAIMNTAIFALTEYVTVLEARIQNFPQ
jgi:hypothetical protein